MTSSRNRVLCIVGPTASGKSDLAQNVALELGGEVISADSMQIYRGMDIGTGKVTERNRKVPHWGIDILDPGEPYSAALFQAYSRACFDDIWNRTKLPVLAGGTGLYVRAAIDDYDFPAGEQVDNPIREKYEAFAAEHGNIALWESLNEKDPKSASVLHPNNVRRVVRALELLEQGKSYAEQVENLKTIPQAVPAVFIGMHVDVDVLNDAIDQRVDNMREKGLVDEVEHLLDLGFRNGVTAPQAIGYKEIVSALDGNISLDDAFEDIKRSTRRYAKRQRTWFRRDDRINWIDATRCSSSDLAEEAMSIYKDFTKR